MTSPIPPSRTWPKSSISAARVTNSASLGSLAPSLTTMMPYGLPPARRFLSSSHMRSMSTTGFGDQDVVGGRCDPRIAGDPAGVAAHRLDDHDPPVRLGGRLEAVDRLHHDIDARVEAERDVGRAEVVIDRLGDADGGQAAIGEEFAGDAERVVAADGDQGVQLEPFERLDEAFDVLRLACTDWCATSRGSFRRGR